MEFNQVSFSGGMNLLVDDTRLAPNEYREAFNLRNRFDVLDGVKEAVDDITAPSGNKQGLYTFGDYMLLFCGGLAYYKHRSSTGWVQVSGFSMSGTVPRFYIVAVPVTTVLHARTLDNYDDFTGPVITRNLVVGGTQAGVLVQDGVNQAQFIWVNVHNQVQCRTTQRYSDWKYDPTGVDDRREYVPIGTFMEWFDGILYIVAPDFTTIYRSVTGRPLDFVVNVDKDGNKGGDATTTSFSVGTNGITCVRALSSDGLFVAAANRFCYLVTPNRSPEATKICGEPTFIRRYLFDSGCVNDKSFVDILGDFAFIDPEGLRSFNAVQQIQYEGRNSVFSLKVAALFRGILQSDEGCAAITFDNYALFSMNTAYGYKIIVYDTLNKVFVCMDDQTGGIGVKQFAKIDTNITELYAITTDDRVLKLYAGTQYATSTCRIQSFCSQDPKVELKPTELRCVLSKFWVDSTVTCAAFVNNRLFDGVITKNFRYITPPPYNLSPAFSDVNSQVVNIMFNWIGVGQGWKCFFHLSWTGGGSITNVKITAQELTPFNPLLSQ